MKNFVGGGTNKVYYRRCANGEQPISWPYEVCIIVFNFSWDNLNTSRKKEKTTKVLQNFVGEVGEGANKVYYGRCANGEQPTFQHGFHVQAVSTGFSALLISPPSPSPLPRERQRKIYLIWKPPSHCIYFLECMRQDTIAFWCSRNQ